MFKERKGDVMTSEKNNKHINREIIQKDSKYFFERDILFWVKKRQNAFRQANCRIALAILA